MDRLFLILAVILAGVAAFFLWNGYTDGVFVSAVLGCVSFFLSIRYQIKKRITPRALEQEREREQENEIDEAEDDGGNASI